MINVTLVRSEEGLVLGCRAEGHAGFGKKGYDLVCAAVTVLIRTAARTMESRDRVVLEGTAPEPGLAGFRLVAFDRYDKDWLLGLGDGLMTGLLDIQEEYPGFCQVEIVRETVKE